MSEIDRYNKFIRSILSAGRSDLYDFTDKAGNAWAHIIYMLNRTQSMFRWEGLPESIPQRMLELYLQIGGYVGIAEHEGTLYAFRGGLGGEPDVYYMPTIFTVANPALDYSANLRIGEEVIVISDDSLYTGLMPMFDRYSAAIAENELSFRVALINSRIVDLITAPDDRTFKSAVKFLEDVEAGKLGAISSNEFLDGLKAQPYAHSGSARVITDLIESEQYLRASWYNELGLNANYNMKREALSTAESQLNDDALLPLVDDMLRCRQEGAEKVNAMFGTDISVTLASSWEDNQQEVDAEQEKLESEGDPAEEPAEEPEEVKEDE